MKKSDLITLLQILVKEEVKNQMSGLLQEIKEKKQTITSINSTKKPLMERKVVTELTKIKVPKVTGNAALSDVLKQTAIAYETGEESPLDSGVSPMMYNQPMHSSVPINTPPTIKQGNKAPVQVFQEVENLNIDSGEYGEIETDFEVPASLSNIFNRNFSDVLKKADKIAAQNRPV